MSTPDYPLLTVPGYELYQLAHLTTFVVDALARHRRAAEARDRRTAGPPLLSRRPLMQLTAARHRSTHRSAGSRPRRPPCPVPGLRRSPAAPPVHATAVRGPDLAPLPRRGRRLLADRRPLLRPRRPNRRHPPDVIAPARRLLGEIPPPDLAAPRRTSTQHATTSEARAVCQQCGGHFDITTARPRGPCRSAASPAVADTWRAATAPTWTDADAPPARRGRLIQRDRFAT